MPEADTDTLSDTLRVELAERSYDIVVGAGLLASLGRRIVALGRKSVFIITDETVAGLYLTPALDSCRAAGLKVQSVVVPSGEQAKSFEHLGRVLDALLEAKAERKSLIVALGGGIVGDLAGFAAAILLRGVDFIQVPTTLLAQVDSSVGGKTGINVRQGKNLIGAFHQPLLVLADTDTLGTLPEREVKAGYAEVAKYGLIDDLPFWEWLEQGGGAGVLRGDADARRQAILTSCAAKARVVGSDEREQEGGRRALLNLGHTFAHALEAEGGYGGPLLHGEAVSVGMVMAFDLSVALGLCPPEDAARVRRHLQSLDLAVVPPKVNGLAMNPERLLAHMASDKKVAEGKVTFIVARGIGQSFQSRDVPPAAVLDILTRAVS